MMTETTLKVEFVMGLYNLIPNRAIAETIVANMKEIGAPKYTAEDIDFAKKINAGLDRQVKIDDMKRQRVPEWERYADMEIADDVLDPFGEDYCSAGSTDVGDVSWVVPAVEYETSTYPLGSPGHSWQWVACGAMGLGHKSLIFSSKVTAGAVLDLLTKPELLKTVKEEHNKRLAGRKYVSPIPAEIQPPLEMAKQYAEKNRGKD